MCGVVWIDRCSFSSWARLRFKLTLSGTALAVKGMHGARLVLLLMWLAFFETGWRDPLIASKCFCFARCVLFWSLFFFVFLIFFVCRFVFARSASAVSWHYLFVELVQSTAPGKGFDMREVFFFFFFFRLLFWSKTVDWRVTVIHSFMLTTSFFGSLQLRIILTSAAFFMRDYLLRVYEIGRKVFFFFLLNKLCSFLPVNRGIRAGSSRSESRRGTQISFPLVEGRSCENFRLRYY